MDSFNLNDCKIHFGLSIMSRTYTDLAKIITKYLE